MCICMLFWRIGEENYFFTFPPHSMSTNSVKSQLHWVLYKAFHGWISPYFSMLIFQYSLSQILFSGHKALSVARVSHVFTLQPFTPALVTCAWNPFLLLALPQSPGYHFLISQHSCQGALRQGSDNPFSVSPHTQYSSAPPLCHDISTGVQGWGLVYPAFYSHPASREEQVPRQG